RPDEMVFPGVLTTAAAILVEATPGPCVEAAGLSRAAWLTAIASGRADPAPAPRAVGTPLGQLFRVRRGIATGKNSFFVLTDAAAAAHRLPRDCLVRCIASPRDPAPRWLLRVRRLSAAVRAYLGGGERAGVADGYLCRTRTPWWRVEDVPAAPILVGYMARG